ncbi:DUF4135 domain-containing protein [Stenotrophomonas sp. LGBM10]|uniref:DUF4135 domain-containing protein n=1 Tax=Stenotrophomonas sp. LGBM10 TaxID=3390038 RepID=UPI00398AAB78
MDTLILFAATPPRAGGPPPLRVQVPERLRAQLYKADLEAVALGLAAYAARHPRVADALADAALLGSLALLLDGYVTGSVVADLNAFAANSAPGQPITEDATYPRYISACLQHAVDPYVASADWPQILAPVGAPPWEGVQAFNRRYPMTRRMVETTAANFQRNILQCCDRVLEDWPDLEAFFFGGTGMQALTEIGATGSDFHKGGGQVLLLTFRDAAALSHRLVYKPSDVERDFRIVGDTHALTAALNANQLRAVIWKGVTQTNLLNNAAGSLAEMLTAQAAGQFACVASTYRILPVWPGTSLVAVNGQLPVRQSYGYTEFLSSAQGDNRFTSGAQRDTFYRSFGGLLALCWLLQVTDMHQENLIVHAHMPYLIDLEMAPSGIQALPGDTSLSGAYRSFEVPVQRRHITYWGTSRLEYEPMTDTKATQNALYDTTGVLTQPSPTDKNALLTTFQNAVGLIIANQPGYNAWLQAAQRVVTRILLTGTDELMTQLRRYNSFNEPDHAAHSPAEIVLDCQRAGRISMQRWATEFYTTANPPAGALTRAQLNLAYTTVRPSFAIWLDPQTAADFIAGDIPTSYQQMISADAMSSIGKVVTVDYGAAVQAAIPVNQQTLSNLLVTLWGTPAPLLPATYFTEPVVQMQQAYLTAMQQNNGNFATTRINAAVAEVSRW